MISPGDEFTQRVYATIKKYRLIRPEETVLASVSGGPDSVALLHALHNLGYSLRVAHLDHQTRGEASQTDAEFVRSLAQTLSLPFHMESRPVEEEAKAVGANFEEYARNVRYAFLMRIAKERGCPVIATGHHGDDRAETVLIRVLRGTGPLGLPGLPPLRVSEGIRVVRPLFECTRTQIKHWLSELGVAWRRDASNAEQAFLRNRIRLELLPLLERNYNTRVRNALLRLAETQRCENDLLEQLAQQAWDSCVTDNKTIDRQAFSHIHESLQRRCILRLGWECGIQCPYERTKDAAAFICSAPTGTFFDFGGDISLYSGRTHTEVVKRTEEAESSVTMLLIPGEAKAMGCRFSARLLDRAPEMDLRKYCTPRRQVFDADRVGAFLEVRSRRDGDRIRPFGMEGEKKLQDYFVDIGLPAPQRDAQPLLVANNRILWVVGYATSAESAVYPATTRFLEIEVEPCA